MHLSEKESVQNHHNVSAKSYFCFTTSVQKQEEMMAHNEVKRLILTKEGRLNKNHFCRSFFFPHFAFSFYSFFSVHLVSLLAPSLLVIWRADVCQLLTSSS